MELKIICFHCRVKFLNRDFNFDFRKIEKINNKLFFFKSGIGMEVSEVRLKCFLRFLDLWK